MEKLQFRVLYRQFLFRMVDLELLSASAQGDIGKLLGQMAGLLIFFSSAMALGALLFDGRSMERRMLLVTIWSTEHFLIATTMLVAALLAVLSWDAAFPDRRDVLVLAPLPVRSRTLFLAKLAALMTALGLAVVCLNSLAGLIWPMEHFVPRGGSALRTLAAYWVAALSGGAFVLGSVLSVQGLAAQLLPRRHFLRLSGLLQLAAFCLFLGGYFLEPSLEAPEALVASANRHWLAGLPSYWFWGLFQTLNGSAAPPGVGLVWAALTRRAVTALAITGFGTGTAFLLSYFRTIRKIVESPDIALGPSVLGLSGAIRPVRFGNPSQTAVVQFILRTLLRSRQHRLLLAFYLGTGLSFVIFLMQAPAPETQQGHGQASLPALTASLVMLCCWVAGTRIVFSRPLEIRANWIFRVAAGGEAAHYSAAARQSLLLLAVLLADWPWRLAVSHLAMLGLLGTIAADASLYRFRKIPFTCTYLPGKSQVHMVFLACYGFLLLVFQAARLEQAALASPAELAAMLAAMCAGAVLVRHYSKAQLHADWEGVRFEESATPAVLRLGLNRDGVSPV
jgi:hypothetical protein